MRGASLIVLTLVLAATVPAEAGQFFFSSGDGVRIDAPFHPRHAMIQRHVFRHIRRFHARNDFRFNARNDFLSSPFLSSPFLALPVAVPGDPAPPATIVEGGPPTPPPVVRSEADERPTVETTPSGVQIVRGPGSRHTQH